MSDRDFLADLCWRLGRMVIGRAAAGLAPCRPAGAVVVPVWVWLRPNMDMGRKGAGLVPVRVAYGDDDCPVVLVPPGGVVEVPWRAIGAGWDLSGSVLVTAGDVAGLPVMPPYGRVPTSVPITVVAPVLDVLALLSRLVKDGELARWELLEDFTVMARKYIWRSRSGVMHAVECGEMVERGRMRLVRGEVDAMADEIVVRGDGLSRADRLLGHCLLPTTFAKVDPLRYVAVGLRVAAHQAVRRHIGDPQVGPEVRRIADALALPRHREPTAEEVNLVVKAYGAAHAKARLGRNRAVKALEARTGATVLLEPDPVVADVAEEATELVFVSRTIVTIVACCQVEGGDKLAEVAGHWLPAVASGRKLTLEDLSAELHCGPDTTRRLVRRVQEIATQVMLAQEAA